MNKLFKNNNHLKTNRYQFNEESITTDKPLHTLTWLSSIYRSVLILNGA